MYSYWLNTRVEAFSVDWKSKVIKDLLLLRMYMIGCCMEIKPCVPRCTYIVHTLFQQQMVLYGVLRNQVTHIGSTVVV